MDKTIATKFVEVEARTGNAINEFWFLNETDETARQIWLDEKIKNVEALNGGGRLTRRQLVFDFTLNDLKQKPLEEFKSMKLTDYIKIINLITNETI